MDQKYKGHRILSSLCLLASFLILLAGCAQKNALFILGSIQPQGEDSCRISCQDPDKAAIIPEQEFAFDGESLSLTIGEYQCEFQKTDDVPAIIGDVSRYS